MQCAVSTHIICMASWLFNWLSLLFMPTLAVRCLYSTFEAWYDKHPGGFSLGPIDHRKRDEAKNEHEEKLQRAGTARERDQASVSVVLCQMTLTVWTQTVKQYRQECQA
eukprot:1156964-Pelagomonas_calceolata.AAC.11